MTAAGQEAGVADRLDLHLAEHLRDDDLDVLVVDVDALAAVDVLHLADQVVLHRLDRRVMRRMSCGTSGPSTSGVAGLDVVAGVDAQVLAVRDEVLALSMPGFVARRTDDGPLAAALLAQSSTRAGDLGHDGRVLAAGGPRRSR